MYQTLQKTKKTPWKRNVISGALLETIFRHHVINPEILDATLEEPFPIPLNYIDVVRHTQNGREEKVIRFPTRSWKFKKWLEASSDASDRLGFESYLDAHGTPQYIRAIQGHSGTPRIDPKFCTLIKNLKKWKVHSYHTGSSHHYVSFVEGGLIAAGPSDRRGRQTHFFSAMNPLEESLTDFREFFTNKPQMMHCRK